MYTVLHVFFNVINFLYMYMYITYMYSKPTYYNLFPLPPPLL